MPANKAVSWLKYPMSMGGGLFSGCAFAIETYIKQLELPLLVQAIYVAAGALGLLLLIVFIQAFSIQSKKRKQKKLANEIEVLNKQRQRLQIGLLHLDENNAVLYGNRMGAYLLAKKPEQLRGLPILEALHKVNVQVDATQFSRSGLHSEVLFFPDKNRFIQCSIETFKHAKEGVAKVVTLEDVTTIKRAWIDSDNAVEHHKAMLTLSHQGQLFVDFEQQTCRVDAALIEKLQLANKVGDGDELGIEAFNQIISAKDAHKWIQFLNVLQQGEEAQAFCHAVIDEQTRYCKFIGKAHAFDEKGKVTHVHIVLQDWSELDEERQQGQLLRNQYKGVLSSSSVATYVLDKEGRVVDCNNIFESLFVVRLHDIQNKPIHDCEFLPDAIRKMHPVSPSAGLGVGGIKEVEYSAADGTKKHIKVTVKTFMDANATRAGMVGSITDLTELNALKSELSHAQKRFIDTLQRAPIALALTDSQDEIVMANNALTQRLEMSEQELKSTSFYQLFNDPMNAANAAKMLHKTGALSGLTAHLKGKNSAIHPSLLHATQLDSETGEFLYWIEDLSAQQFHQDKFDSLLEHSSMPMAELSDKGFVKLNPAACQFFSIDDEKTLYGHTPYSPGLNESEEKAQELSAKLAQVKDNGQALSLVWQHHNGEEALPCHATFIPMYKQGEFASILCVWMDLRELKKADSARMEAINLHQAAAREAKEKQQLLETSQDQLASRERSLSETHSKLQAIEADLSEKQSEFSQLQRSHEEVTAHLNTLQQDYTQNRAQLAKAQEHNADLEAQLAQSSEKVLNLQQQRNQIADALQNSERQFMQAQEQLRESELASEKLQQAQQEQQAEIAQYEKQINGLKQSIEQKDKQMSEVSDKIVGLQSQLSSSGQVTEKLRQQLINQRKASELALLQQREVEMECRKAQAELASKAQHIEHLQHEMHKFEEMSSQQKGDMEKQNQALQQELSAKQEMLQQTKQELEDSKKQAEQEKAENEKQQQTLTKLQQELRDMEQHTKQQQKKIAQADAHWQQQREQLQSALKDKQAQLQAVEKNLNESKQQTEAERQEKARQQQIFDRLQAELADMEQRSIEQQQQIAESEQQYQAQQQKIQQDIEDKQRQLQQAQQKLHETERQSEAERIEREEQQRRLEQLKTELSDVESRAEKQKQMIEGSDEQRRQHRAEIEQQKLQLQQALAEAEKQNAQMKASLEKNLSELEEAENRVSSTQQGEQSLLQELERAKQEAQELEKRIAQQEQQEAELKHQLQTQQDRLEQRESSISELESEQARLREELQNVQSEYAKTKSELNNQDTDQHQLTEQLKALEAQLLESEKQLENKENALQNAQQQIHSSTSKLAQQEKELLEAHQQELKRVQQQQDANSTSTVKPEIAALPLPEHPEIWFDLIQFLQQNPSSGPLSVVLSQLVEELDNLIKAMDKAVAEDKTKDILVTSRKLALIAKKINTRPLADLAARMEDDFELGEPDNISIFWPSGKNMLNNALRVIYSQLHN